MLLDQRSKAILSHLSLAQGYVSMKEIEEKFNISRRTVYYSIEKINGYLKIYKLPEVHHVRSAGFHVTEETAKHIHKALGDIKENYYELSAEERRAWLAISILNKSSPLYLEKLTKKNQVSRNTTIEDLKELRNDLLRFDLLVEFNKKSGYEIKGHEYDKRKALFFYVRRILPKEGKGDRFSRILIDVDENAEKKAGTSIEEELNTVEGIVAESEKKLGIRYTDEFLNNLSIQLLLLVNRLSLRELVDVDSVEKEILSETREYWAAQEIARKLSVYYKIDFPDNEIFYITKHLLSSRVQLAENLLEGSIKQAPYSLKEVVSELVTDFQKYACVIFENKEEVEETLLLHIKPAFYRNMYGLEVENEITSTVKEKYPDTFRITRKVSEHLTKISGNPLSDSEVALIAIHFGGWLKKMNTRPAERKNALIVCTTGVGTSRLLKYQLEGIFSAVDFLECLSLRDFYQTEYDHDFVISTVPIEKSDKPVFIVSPILTDIEKENLLKKVNGSISDRTPGNSSVDPIMKMIKNYANVFDEKNLKKELQQLLHQHTHFSIREAPKQNLSELIKLEHIQVVESAANWQEAIKQAAAPLVADKYINSNYVQAMIDILTQMGPYVIISPKVAIPHARSTDGVNKLGLSLLKLKESVPFSEKEAHKVSLIIILATVDGESHLKALEQLTRILNKKELKESLLSADSSEKIYRLVEGFNKTDK